MVCRMSGSGLPDMGSLKIDPQTEVRFNQFLQTFRSYGNNLKTAQPFLKRDSGIRSGIMGSIIDSRGVACNAPTIKVSFCMVFNIYLLLLICASTP